VFLILVNLSNMAQKSFPDLILSTTKHIKETDDLKGFSWKMSQINQGGMDYINGEAVPGLILHQSTHSGLLPGMTLISVVRF
jgi:hypothetical protein